MSSKNNMIMDITMLIESISTKNIFALDIEGAPCGINQISLVNGKGKMPINMYGDKLNGSAIGTLKEKQINHIKSIINNVKILVGFNISGDLSALAKQGIEFDPNVVIVDLFHTVQYLAECGAIEKLRLPNMTLKGVAEYFSINDVTGYHNSQVDATVTMRLFHIMNDIFHGKFFIMTNIRDKEVSQKKVNEVAENKVKEETQMANTIIDWEQNYAEEAENEIYKSPQGFYEALVPIKNEKRIVRMSEEEYEMYLKLRTMAPGYPLRVYYLTILAPGIRSAILNHVENEGKETVQEIPVAFCSEESEQNPVTEVTEAENTETI